MMKTQEQIKKALIESYKTNHDIDFEFLEKYFQICFEHSTEPKKFLTENHHILPKQVFSDYSKESWNIVTLSLYDHILAHYYLYKAFGNKHSFYSMARTIGQIKNPKIVEHISEKDLIEFYKMKEIIHKEFLEKITQFNPKRGKKLTDEQKNNIRQGNLKSEKSKRSRKELSLRRWVCKGEENHFVLPSELDYYLNLGFVFGRKKSTAEKIAKANTGRKESESQKEKIRAAMKSLGDKHHMKTKEKREWARQTALERFPNYTMPKGVYCFVTDGETSFRIKLSELEEYESKGYVRGSSSLWMMSPDGKRKRVPPNETKDYLDKGWRYGKV